MTEVHGKVGHHIITSIQMGLFTQATFPLKYGESNSDIPSFIP